MKGLPFCRKSTTDTRRHRFDERWTQSDDRYYRSRPWIAYCRAYAVTMTTSDCRWTGASKKNGDGVLTGDSKNDDGGGGGGDRQIRANGYYLQTFRRHGFGIGRRCMSLDHGPTTGRWRRRRAWWTDTAANMARASRSYDVWNSRPLSVSEVRDGIVARRGRPAVGRYERKPYELRRGGSRNKTGFLRFLGILKSFFFFFYRRSVSTFFRVDHNAREQTALWAAANWHRRRRRCRGYGRPQRRLVSTRASRTSLGAFRARHRRVEFLRVFASASCFRSSGKEDPSERTPDRGRHRIVYVVFQDVSKWEGGGEIKREIRN